MQQPTGVELHIQGNNVYREGGRTEEALALYEKALTLIREGPERVLDLEIKLCSNAALCHMSLRNYQVQWRFRVFHVII